MGLCITKEMRNEALEPYEDPTCTMCPIAGYDVANLGRDGVVVHGRR